MGIKAWQRGEGDKNPKFSWRHLWMTHYTWDILWPVPLRLVYHTFINLQHIISSSQPLPYVVCCLLTRDFLAKCHPDISSSSYFVHVNLKSQQLATWGQSNQIKLEVTITNVQYLTYIYFWLLWKLSFMKWLTFSM